MKDNTQANWTVESMDWKRHRDGVTYKVSKTKQGRYHCTCEAFRFGEGEECKHIDYVRTHPEILPDAERMTGDTLAVLLNQALQGKREVTVHIKNGTITLSDR